jgi:hypothetical protein
VVYTWGKTGIDWVRAVRGGLPTAPIAPSGPTPTPTPTPECTTAGDCPATGNECIAATCNATVCGTQNLGNAHVLSTGQVTGDCQDLVCDGAGGTTSIDAPADLPLSTTACKAPSCSGPSPLHPTFANAPTGADCSADNNPPNHVCGDTSNVSVAGKCVECNTNADCPNPTTCFAFICQ